MSKPPSPEAILLAERICDLTWNGGSCPVLHPRRISAMIEKAMMAYGNARLEEAAEWFGKQEIRYHNDTAIHIVHDLRQMKEPTS